MEVGLDRLLGGDVVILLQHLAAHADGGLEQRRRGGLPPEKGDDALRDGALALPVAPAGGLDSILQASIREVEITRQGRPPLSRRRISSSLARRWAGYMRVER